MTQTNSKTNWVAIVLLIIVLFATAFGALCYFDDGFKDKIFGMPDNSAIGKELVSTTIVNETYGTFELSANSMILNYMETQRDLLFENGTNFNYLMEESIEFYNSLNISDEMLLKDDGVVGILANTGTSGKFMSDGSVTMWRDTYLKLPNNDFIKSDIGIFLSQGEKDYGKNWVSVLWWNGKNIETYDSGVLKDAQSLIDFYHFSKARTKVIFRHNGEDITNKVKINPLYRDIFKDKILESLGIK